MFEDSGRKSGRSESAKVDGSGRFPFDKTAGIGCKASSDMRFGQSSRAKNKKDLQLLTGSPSDLKPYSGVPCRQTHSTHVKVERQVARTPVIFSLKFSRTKKEQRYQVRASVTSIAYSPLTKMLAQEPSFGGQMTSCFLPFATPTQDFSGKGAAHLGTRIGESRLHKFLPPRECVCRREVRRGLSSFWKSR